MIEVRQTVSFKKWLGNLADVRARTRIQMRIDRMELGLLGDAKFLGSGVSELRVDYGPGYRVYFTRRGDVWVVLLCGGDKRTQASDIEKAKVLAKDV